MKRILIFMCLFFCLFSFVANAETYTFEQFESQTDLVVDISGFDMPDDVESLLNLEDTISSTTLLDIVSGDGLAKIYDYILAKITAPLKFTVTTLVAIIISALIKSAENFTRHNDVIEFVLSLIFICVCTSSMISVIRDCAKAVGSIGVFMFSFIPVFMAIIASTLKTGVAAGTSNSLFLCAQIINSAANKIVIPLSSASLALGISSGLSGERLKGLSSGIKKCVTFCLSLLTTIFLGILTIKTAVFSIGDSTTLKTAKFLSGSFIPVAGSAIGDMLSGLLYCITTLRSTVGILGIIIVLLIILPTIAQLIVFKFCTSICSFACSVFSETSAEKIMLAFSDTLSILLAISIISAIMCIFSITILILGCG